MTFPHLQSLHSGCFLLAKEHSNVGFCKVFILSSDKSDIKTNFGKNFGRFQVAANLMQEIYLFQIKLFDRKCKETTLAKYFIKATTRPSFM